MNANVAARKMPRRRRRVLGVIAGIVSLRWFFSTSPKSLVGAALATIVEAYQLDI
jgi:hypothetical protein